MEEEPLQHSPTVLSNSDKGNEDDDSGNELFDDPKYALSMFSY